MSEVKYEIDLKCEGLAKSITSFTEAVNGLLQSQKPEGVGSPVIVENELVTDKVE